MGTVVEISAQQAAVLKAFDEIAARAKKTEKGFSDNVKEAQRLERAAKKSFESTRTPAERLERKLKDISKQFSVGKISADTFKRASVKAHTDHRIAIERANKEMLAAKKAGESAFGPQMLRSIGATVGGVVSLGAAMGLVTKAMQQAFDLSIKASELQQSNAPAFSGLAELSGGSSTKLKTLIKNAEEIQLAAGHEDAKEASQIVFELESAGANTARQRKFAGDLATISDDPSAVIAGAAKVQRGFGSKEAGEIDEIVSKAGFAAADLPTVGRDRLMGAAAGVSGTAKSLNLSDEETLAALALLGSAAKSESEGSTQLKALLTAAKRTGLADELGDDFSIRSFVSAVETKKLNRQELIRFLGTTEGADAFAQLAPIVQNKQLTQFTRQIGAAGEARAAGRDVLAARNQDEIEGPRVLAQSEAAEQADLKTMGSIATIRDSIRSQQRKHDRKYFGETGVGIRDLDRSFGDWMAGPNSTSALQGALREELADPNQKKFTDELLLLILKKLAETRAEHSPFGRGEIDRLTAATEASGEFEGVRDLLERIEQNTAQNPRPAGDNIEQHTE